MKATKKFLAALLALAMILSFAVTAFADGTTPTSSITVPDNGHTYEIYQIFTGEISDGKLINVKWGKNGTGDEGKEVPEATLTAIAAFTGTDKEKANKVASYVNFGTSETPANPYAKAKNETITVPAGYYLIKDVDSALTGEGADAYTVYIVKVAGEAEFSPKADKPTLDKQIKHNELEKWGVVGDNQIGDTVEFRTITTVPDYTGEYDSYTYTIHDTMSDGLTSNVTALKDITVKINDSTVLDSKYCKLVTNGNTFALSIDIKTAIKDEALSPKTGTEPTKLYTYYSGVLNENAKIYQNEDGEKQDNVAYLEYSNNPYDGSKTVKTPKKKVYDWTFTMTVSKIDGTNNTKITGAKFVLSQTAGLTPALDENDELEETDNLMPLIFENNNYRIPTDTEKEDANTEKTYIIDAGDATIIGLDDAKDYYLYEVKAPEGYNPLDKAVKFKVNAAYDETGNTCKTMNLTVDNATADGLTVKVANKSGATLPETGGMGTTLFYVAGSILVIFAVVMLVSKKRMGAPE